jgi:GH15 family glucan-1,4-alpha-glucosidase
MEQYPAIAEHGLIGDLQTAALVGTDGCIDWFCCPRFDSPSVFASLLDRNRGGRFRITVEGDRVVRQLYFPDTAILVTRFMTPDGVGEVVDFMPVSDQRRASGRHRLVRMVRCVRGEIRFVLECAPRFDYGRQDHCAPARPAGWYWSRPPTARPGPWPPMSCRACSSRPPGSGGSGWPGRRIAAAGGR